MSSGSFREYWRLGAAKNWQEITRGGWRDAIVRNDKGKVVCHIQCAHEGRFWLPHHPLALWRDSKLVEAWAWVQAASLFRELHGLARGEVPSIRNFTCVACGLDTVALYVGRPLWSLRYHTKYYKCLNPDCAVYDVQLPASLMSHLAETPEEYA